MDNEHLVRINSGRRPVWRTILTALFLTALILLVAADIFMVVASHFEEKDLYASANSLGLMGFLLAGAATFGTQKDMVLDGRKNQIESCYYIGWLQHTVRSTLPDMEYVSVFLDGKGMYETNLWYKDNKRLALYDFDEKSQAMDFAKDVARKLSIDLLDATDGANRQWVEL
jgi:hypothetical protein